MTCNRTIGTLRCLQQLYKTVDYEPTANGNSIGITGYDAQFSNKKQYYTEQRPDVVNPTFRLLSVNGGQEPQNTSSAGVEADLDIEVAFPIPGTFYTTAGSPPFVPDEITPTITNELYAEWLDSVLHRYDNHLVVSTSYGDDEQTVPKSYAERVHKDLAQLHMRRL